jgi:cell division protein FtsZ
MSLYEVNEAASLIQEEAHEDANIIFGAVIDDKIADEIHVTVIATGFGDRDLRPAMTPIVRYSPSGAPITAPVVAAPTRPIEPVQPQIPLPPPIQPTPIQPTQNQMFAGKPIRRLGMIVDESTLDIPTFKRRAGGDPGPTHVGQTDTLENDDKLEIPAFLRKPND